VASADELIREAQYAFSSISHGSTNERKYRARAERYAKRVIRQHPASIEALQARTILGNLNLRVDVRSQQGVSPQANAAADFEKSHSSDSNHSRSVGATPPTTDATFQQTYNDEWRDLLRRFMELPQNKKKYLGIIAAIAIFVPGGIFAVFGLIIFYALQPALLKRHLNLLLDKLGSR